MDRLTIKSIAIILATSPMVALANPESGFVVGGGAFSASNSSCTDCDYTGEYIELGFDFNDIVGIEGKMVSGENDESTDLTINYFGVNVGHDFNTNWFRLYGKAGYAHIQEEVQRLICYESGVCYNTYYDADTNSGLTAGVGARFSLFGKADGLYIKIESNAVSFADASTGAALSLGLGYRF